MLYKINSICKINIIHIDFIIYVLCSSSQSILNNHYIIKKSLVNKSEYFVLYSI